MQIKRAVESRKCQLGDKSRRPGAISRALRAFDNEAAQDEGLRREIRSNPKPKLISMENNGKNNSAAVADKI